MNTKRQLLLNPPGTFRGGRSHVTLLYRMLATLLLIGQSHGDTLPMPWYPEDLGRTLSLTSPEVLKGYAVLLDTTKPSQPVNASLKIDGRFVKDVAAVHQTLGIEASVSVRGILNKFSAGVNFNFDKSTLENSVTFAVAATKDFGARVFPIVGCTPQFNAFVETNIHNGVIGPALGMEIEKTFGTHFVRGYSEKAWSLALFSYRFASSDISQSRKAWFETTFNRGRIDVKASVEDLLKNSTSGEKLEVRFYTSSVDGPPVPQLTEISSVGAYLDYYNKVVAFTESLKTGNKVGYIVDRLDTVACFPMTLGDHPFRGDYENLVSTWSELSALVTRTDAMRRSRDGQWLNSAQGQPLLIAWNNDLRRAKTRLENMARAHFDTGTPLVVPEDSFNHLLGESRVPVPKVTVMGHFVHEGLGVEMYVGAVEIGPWARTTEKPFTQLYLFDESDGRTSAVPLTFDSTSFEESMLSASRGGDYSYLRSLVVGFKDSEPFKRASYLVDHEIYRLGFFVFRPESRVNPGGVICGVKNGYGEFVAISRLDDLGEVQHQEKQEAQLKSDLRLNIEAIPTRAVAGQGSTWSLTISNAGPGLAQEVRLRLPKNPVVALAPFETVDATGSQTDSGFEVKMSPLGAGWSRNITLSLVGLEAGCPHPWSTVAEMSPLIEELSTTDNEALVPLPCFTPVPVAFARDGDTLRLTWRDDSGGLLRVHSTRNVAGPRTEWIPFEVDPSPNADGSYTQVCQAPDHHEFFYVRATQ